MNQAPTLGKMREDIDSHFHGNDRGGSGNERKEKKKQMGTIHRAPTLGKIRKEKERFNLNLNRFLFLRFLVFFC